MSTDGKRTRETTETSLDVLERLHDLGGARVSDLADAMDMAKSTVHTHLYTLRRRGYVTKEGERYRVGLRLFHLGERAKSRHTIYDLAKPYARELVEQTNEEVEISVEEHGRLVVIYDEVGNASKAGSQVGTLYYMHSTSAGKAHLADMPRRRVEEILDRWGLPARTERTIVDREELYAELDRIGERGYAVNDGENYEGVAAVSSTITDDEGTVRGAITISGPAYRLPSEAELAATLLPTVDAIERALANEPGDSAHEVRSAESDPARERSDRSG